MKKAKEIFSRTVQYLKTHPAALKSLIAAISFILGVQVSEEALMIVDVIIQFLGVLF